MQLLSTMILLWTIWQLLLLAQHAEGPQSIRQLGWYLPRVSQLRNVLGLFMLALAAASSLPFQA